MPKSVVKTGDLFRMGFGQSVALTPLGLITSVSACINGGKLMQPHFVTKITNSQGSVLYEKSPTTLKNVLKSSVSSTLNPLLYAVVNSGGGKHAKVDGYDICGKTGVLPIYYDIKLLGEIKPQVFFIYWIR